MEKYFVIDESNTDLMGSGATIEQALDDLGRLTGIDYKNNDLEDVLVIKGKEIQIKKIVQFEEI